MVYALKVKLGLEPDVMNIQSINRRQAEKLISGLVEEVNALEGRCPTCGYKQRNKQN